MNTIVVLLGVLLVLLPPVARADAAADTALAGYLSRSRDLVNGYERTIAGDPLDYHSVHPFVRTALLVRATDGRRTAEWETAPAPGGPRKQSATFAWLAALSGSKGVKQFTLAVNGADALTFTTLPDSLTPNWTVTGPSGVALAFHATEADRFQDLFGYMFLTVPAALLRKGEPVRIRVTGEQAASQAWFMVFQHPLVPGASVRALPALVSACDTVCQPVRVDLEHYGPPKEIRVGADSASAVPVKLTWGARTVTVPFKAVDSERQAAVWLIERGRPAQLLPVTLRPVTPRTLYVLPHSHTDIGYSAHQEQVERDHIRYIDRAMALAESTRTYPEGSRFVWNIEVAWELERYLARATAEQRERVRSAVAAGTLGINALYTNTLTGIQRPEEILRITAFAREFCREAGVPLTSAMVTDIPASSWSLVTALGLAGVRYFSSGPNYMPSLPDGGDRVGHALRTWGDRPFYWASSNGEHRVLFWMAGRGYSWFHGWVMGRLNQANPWPVFRYLEQLDSVRYPYEIVQLRYTVDGDNGPPDETLAPTVRAWNETYLSPRIIISSTAGMFTEFERRYGATLPVRSGDLTPYWEDGAASTARELALNRETAEQLVQAEALRALSPQASPAVRGPDSAWTDVLLFSEHTWGAHNSVSEPDDPAVIAQWEHKKRFVERAAARASELLPRLPAPPDTVALLEAVNTASWNRTDLVRIPAPVRLRGDRALDEHGMPLASQRLLNGDLVVQIRDVPPLGSRRIRFEPGSPEPPPEPVALGETTLTSTSLGLTLHPSTGAVKSVRWRDKELVDTSRWSGLHQYLYVPGVDPRGVVSDTAVTVRPGEQGPLVASVIVESAPAGTRSFRREISLVALPGGRIGINGSIDKIPVRTKESVHLAFPFRIPDGEVRLDLGWETVRPELDQLPGSNRDFFCVQRWADVSNAEFGVTLVTIDAPLMELGELTDESPGPGGVRVWRDRVPRSQTLFAYAMNNYWHTNYRADQEGPARFRFVLRPHGRFDRAAAYRFGVEASQPLLLRAVSPADPPSGLPFTLIPSGVVVTSVRTTADGRGWILRLFNPSETPDEFLYRWSGPGSGAVFAGDLDGRKGERIQLPVALSPQAVRTIRVERQ